MKLNTSGGDIKSLRHSCMYSLMVWRDGRCKSSFLSVHPWSKQACSRIHMIERYIHIYMYINEYIRIHCSYSNQSQAHRQTSVQLMCDASVVARSHIIT